MKRATFATLKKLAGQNKLHHKIISSFDAMVDGMSSDGETGITSLEDLKRFKTYQNWIEVVDDNHLKLDNCCYSIDFTII